MGNVELVEDRMTFSGLGAGLQRIALPRARLDRIMMMVEYTVTDVGIEANENLRGLINSLYVGEGSRRPFYVETDELGTLIDFMTPGLSQGQLLDGLPTTATEYEAFFNIVGPFNLKAYKDPAIVLQTRKVTDEWLAASAFDATVYAMVEYSDDQGLKGVYLHREQRATDTRHELEMGPGTVSQIFVELGDTKLTKMAVGKVGTAKDFVHDVPDMLTHEYQMYKKAAAITTGRYLVNEVDSKPYSGRKCIMDLSETETCVAWMVNEE